MAADLLSTANFAGERADKAVTALLKWKEESQSDKLQLLPQENFVYLTVTLKNIPPKSRTNPFRIHLPHALFDRSSELCLIVDDRPNSNLTKDKAKEIVKSQDIAISKVLTFSKLRTDYKPYEAKRKLCDSYDLFFSDRRIVPMLPKFLGKHFFGKKKLPLPVELRRMTWKEQIVRACSSAFFFINTGTCCVVKVGRVSMEAKDIAENVVAAVDGIVEILPKKWAAVRSLHLKLSESLSLPLYQALPDLKLRIEGAKESERKLKGDNGGKLVVLKDGNKSKGLPKKQAKNKGRIHTVQYMDQLVGEDVAANGGDDDDDLIDDELDGAEAEIKKMAEIDLVQGQDDRENEDEEIVAVEEKSRKNRDLKKRKASSDSSDKEQVAKTSKVEKKEKKKQKKDRLSLNGDKNSGETLEMSDVEPKSKNGNSKVSNKKSKN